MFHPFCCLQIVDDVLDFQECRPCIPRCIGQKPQALFVRCKRIENRCVQFDRKSAAADLQPSRHDRLHRRHIARAECLKFLRRDTQHAHTGCDVIDGQRLPERSHQQGILLLHAKPCLDRTCVLAVDRPEIGRDLLLDLRKIVQIDRFSVAVSIADGNCTAVDRVMQPLPLLTRCDELCVRVLGVKRQRDVRAVLEHATLKPQEIRVFLEILPDLTECIHACITQADCCCLILHIFLL